MGKRLEERFRIKKKLLITGASGFLGWHLCLEAGAQYRTFGTFLTRRPLFPGVSFYRVDLTRYDDIKALFGQVRPDAVIHAAAQADPNFCQVHPQASGAVNIEAAIAVSGLCADRNIPCVFTSTDLVFDGTAAPYRETDPPAPVCIYGEQKAAAELGMKARYPKVVVCRMPLMFGHGGPDAESFLQPMIQKMRIGEPVKLFVDEYRTPVSGRQAARGLMIALDRQPDVLHLGGPERLSRFELGGLVKKTLRLSAAQLVPIKQCDLQLPAPRPADVSLNSTRARRLGFTPKPIVDELIRDRDVLLGTLGSKPWIEDEPVEDPFTLKKAMALVERVEVEVPEEIVRTEKKHRGLTRQTADKVFAFILRRVSGADPIAAAKRVADLRSRHPDADVDTVVDRLIKAKCQETATVGAVTSAGNMVPGIGTILSLSAGMIVDIGATLAKQADLVLEIAEVHGCRLSDAERNDVLLAVVGVGAGVGKLGNKAVTSLSQKVGEMAAQRWMAKVVPAIGIAAAAGTNVLSTYVIGRRADTYFRLGPEAMGDWKDSMRAISGVDERRIAQWVAESSQRVSGSTARACQTVISGSKHGKDAIVHAGKTAGEALCDGTSRTASALGSTGAMAAKKTRRVSGAVVGAGKKLASVIADKTIGLLRGFSRKRKRRKPRQ